MENTSFCASIPSDGKTWWLRLKKSDLPPKVILTLLLDLPTESLFMHMSDVRKISEFGEYATYRGVFEGEDIGIVYHGSGHFSISTAIEELARVGTETILRVGNSGGISQSIHVGETVVSVGAIREERIMEDYVPVAYPAIADRKIVDAAIQACRDLNVKYYEGLTLSVATFYAGSGFETAAGVFDQTILQRLHLWQKVGVLNVDIETSTVLTMSRLFNMQGGAVLGIGNHCVTGEGVLLEPEVINRLALTGLKTLKSLFK